MADNATFEGIEFTIKEDSSAAVASIDRLSKSLQSLKGVTSGSLTGLTRIATSITKISASLSGLNGSAIAKVNQLSASLNKLGSVSGVKLSSSLPNQLNKLTTAMSKIDISDFDKIKRLSDSLKPLSELGRAQLSSFIKQLGQLPTLIEQLDSANLEKFATQMQKISLAITPLASKMNTVGKSFSSLPGNIYSATRAAEASHQSFSGLLQTFRRFRGGLLAVGYTFKAFGNILGNFIDSSNQYQETLNLFNSTMGELGASSQKTAEHLSEVLGISVKDFMDMQGVFQLLITGFDVADDKAQIMSQNLTQLSFDYASLMNTNVEEAFHKLNSAMTGQIKGLKEYGISLSVANMQEWLTTKGINAKISSLTEAQKTYVRYNMILEKSNNAQGDMSRTLEAPANQLRVLQAQVQLLSRSIGNIFIPILVKVLPYVIAFVKALKLLADSIAKFLGFKLIDVDYSTLDKTSSGIGSISDNLGTAAENAKEVKRYLAGFDELNVIPAPSKSSSGSGLGAGLPEDLGLGVPSYDMLEGITADISAKSDKLVSKMKKLLTVAGLIGVAIAGWKIANALVPMAEGLKTAVKLAETITGINLGSGKILTSLAPIKGQLIAISAVLAVIGLALMNLYKNNEQFRDGLKVMVSFAQKAFGKLKDAIVTVAEKIATLLPEPLRNKLTEFIETVKTSWGEAFLSTIPGVGGLIDSISSLGESFEASGLTVDEYTDKIFEDISNTFSKIGEVFTNAPQKVKEAFDKIGIYFTTLKSTCSTRMTEIKQVITDKFDGIRTWAEKWVTKFKNLFNFTVHIKTPHMSWNYSTNKATGTIAKVLETLGLPTSIPKLNVKWYAQGGLPKMGEVFAARESGPELVGRIGRKTAVMNNDQIITGVANGVYDGVVRAMSGSGGGQPVVVNVTIDGKQAGQAIADWNNSLVRQGLPSPFLV